MLLEAGKKIKEEVMKLLNYCGNEITVKNWPDLDQFNTVVVLIHVIYGDEWAEVEVDGETICEVPSDHALFFSGYNGSYVIYSKEGKDVDIDLLHDPKWLARKDSYEFL